MLKTVSAVFLLLALGSFAHAGDRAEGRKAAMEELKKACGADIEKFCSTVKGGHGRIMRCMKEHKAELSEGCKTQVAEIRDLRKSHRGN